MQVNHAMEQRSKALVTATPWKDAGSSTMDKERAPFGARLALALSAPEHGLELELADDVAVLIDVDGASRDARGCRELLVVRHALELAPQLGALPLARLILGAETA